MYTTPDEDTREQVLDLEELPLLDEKMQEIPIFTLEGKRIRRRIAQLLVDDSGIARPCGLLQDLSLVHTLFDRATAPANRRGDDDYADPAADDPVALWLYPHFFSSQYGQWQADGVMNPALPFLNTINQTLRAHEGVGMCIEPVRSQCYNTYAHETRASARLHVAQRGMLTATIGGAWEGNQKGARTAKNLFEQSDWSMPHERLEAQTDKVANTFLRLEEEFVFHITRFADEHQTGRAFFAQAIQPLVNSGKHNEVLKHLKTTMVVLKPQVSVLC